MTYTEFLTVITDTIRTTTVNGNTLPWYVEISLSDEMELKTGTTYPACFINPIPFDITDDMMVKYGCRIYLLDNVTRSPNYNMNRFNVYNKMVNYSSAFLQQLPDVYINDYPITITPTVLFDANCDGIYFDFVLNNSVECL